MLNWLGATCVHPWLGLQTILKQSHKSNTDLSTSEFMSHIENHSIKVFEDNVKNGYF